MTQLIKVVENSNLEEQESKTILERFGDYEKIAKEWEEKAKLIVVTDESQTTEMAMAKEARKKFSQLRIDVEKARKAMKEQSLRKGQAIDAVAKFLTSLITPIELHLKEQEDFIKIREEKRLEAERVEAERLAEIERQKQLEAEKKEQERIRLENEELRKKALEQEREMQKARDEKLALEKKMLEEQREKQKLQETLKQEVTKKELVLEEVQKLQEKITCPHCGKDFSL